MTPLLEIVRRLESGGARCALGGSGLLAALGLGETVHDWDLTTDAPLARVRTALAGIAAEYHGNDALHADEKLMLFGGEVEVIVGFAFHVNGAIVRIPTMVSGRWRDVPLASPECWAVAYALLGREAKSGSLFAHLERRGADRAIVRRLLAEPLPRVLVERLERLD